MKTTPLSCAIAFLSLFLLSANGQQQYTWNLLAGKLGASGHADGTGASAQFNDPSGVAVDQNGNMDAARCFNGTIRKIPGVGVLRIPPSRGFREMDSKKSDNAGGDHRVWWSSHQAGRAFAKIFHSARKNRLGGDNSLQNVTMADRASG